ncbi:MULTISPECIES: putative quinol monooxygenase [Streptomyces]|uniref:Antibiotic biosynthesis monooxygenase n=2 Tax=Streptomyces TaxID=1883 RepID=A0A939FLZ1_9ACTN|nr:MULTISPECIES: putative quinol monooxygenase [Streptomyces]MBO0654008.1 antibiotic biosynthesis monooxygenase [Streptomyces triculaminicus]QSY48750.1 antibiotic biosynthesis monooxygenase [Streptomyces griseocarneus]
MIFIAVKFTIRPERSARWLEDVAEFTRATREEPGNVFYEWSKSVDDEHQYVLLEAFESAEAGAVHVNSEHFKTAIAWMPDAVAETPQIINVEVPGTGWSAMAEVQPRR